MDKKHLVEAALFMSAEPLTIDQLGKIIESDTLGKTLTVLDAAVAEFNSRASGLEIAKTSDGRYRMQVRQDYLGPVKHLAITTDLPKSILRTLAIIAFKQPIRQSIVVKMRGNKAYDHIERLEGEGFVKKTKEGNTFLIETTKKFIDYFGEPIKGTDFVPKSTQTILGAQAQLAEAAADEAAGVEEAEETAEADEEAEAEAEEVAPAQGGPGAASGEEETKGGETSEHE